LLTGEGGAEEKEEKKERNNHGESVKILSRINCFPELGKFQSQQATVVGRVPDAPRTT